jgi:hypothetical protein
MNFYEAWQAMRQGKKIRQHYLPNPIQMIYLIKDDKLFSEMPVGEPLHIECNDITYSYIFEMMRRDWEIVE